MHIRYSSIAIFNNYNNVLHVNYTVFELVHTRLSHLRSLKHKIIKASYWNMSGPQNCESKKTKNKFKTILNVHIM